MKRWIHASSNVSLGNAYEIRSEGNEWYIFRQGDNELIDGPFDSFQDATDAADELDKPKTRQLTDEEEKRMHEAYLKRFAQYAKSLTTFRTPEGYLATYSRNKLDRFVASFNKANPLAELKVKIGSNSDDIYAYVI